MTSIGWDCCHGRVLMHGELTSGVAWKIGLTYLVPFVVATWGALAASRIASPIGSGGRGSGWADRCFDGGPS
jgi:hypothetical protein